MEQLVGDPGSVASGGPGLSEISHRLPVSVEHQCGDSDVAVLLEQSGLPATVNQLGKITVMLEGDLAELIYRRWEARLFEKDGNVRVAALVFHRDGKPVGDFRKAWSTAGHAAGVPDKLFHDLRRTTIPPLAT